MDDERNSRCLFLQVAAEPREFPEIEMNFAEALAEVGALAIENARMHEAIKEDYAAVMDEMYSFVSYRRRI